MSLRFTTHHIVNGYYHIRNGFHISRWTTYVPLPGGVSIKGGGMKVTPVMEATPASRYPLNPRREKLIEVEIEEILEFHAQNYLRQFASDDEDVTARCSGDVVATAPSAPPPPPLPVERDVSARGSGDALSPTPPAAPAPPDRALLCITSSNFCREHKPTNGRRGDPNYWFFNAVSQGCQACVQKLVKEKHVDKNVRSCNQGYTAIDFAECFGQSEMLAFLATL